MNKLRAAVFALLVAGGMSFGVTASKAAPITFAYEGTISSISSPFVAFNTAAASLIGQTFRLEYTFESTTVDSDADPTQGLYVAAVTALTASLGSNDYTASDGHIDVFDNFFGSFDGYNSISNGAMSGPPIAGTAPERARIVLDDNTQTAFLSDALSTTQPDPAAFTNAFLEVSFNNGSIGSTRSTIRTEDVRIAETSDTSIPEPATLSLLAVGLAGAGFVAWRRRRKTA